MIPERGPCVCDDTVCNLDTGDHSVRHHEHSDFEQFACAEPGCPCEGWRPRGAQPEHVDDAAQEPPDARYRAAVTIPAGALDFSRERAGAAAGLLDSVLNAHTTTGNPDEPLPVLALADVLEDNWPNDIDPLDVLALCIRRLQAATNYRARTLLGVGQRLNEIWSRR